MLTNCKEQATIRIVLLDKVNDVEKALLEATEDAAQESSQAEQMETSINHEMSEDLHNNVGEDISPDIFHERLVIQDFETIEEVEKFYEENFDILSNRYGVLLHLYSVLFTKGIENVLNEISDTSGMR